MNDKFHFEDLPVQEADDFPQEKTNLTGNKSTEARLCAVQAIYQIFVMNKSYNQVRDEFLLHEMPFRKADKKLFNSIMNTAKEGHGDYEKIVSAHLKEGWTLEQLNPVSRSLLVAGIAELCAEQKTPTGVVINEFINISKGFLKAEDVPFIHSTLDTAAKKLRV